MQMVLKQRLLNTQNMQSAMLDQNEWADNQGWS